MTAWKVRRKAHDAAPNLSADTQVFVAASLGTTFQLTGQLRLTKEEADDLEIRLEAKTQHSADLNAEEYNQLQEFLMEWAETDLTALYLADMVRRKFGASARRGSSAG